MLLYRTAKPPARLRVEVLNINDNPPKFDQEIRTVQLEEEAEEGELSLPLSAGFSWLPPTGTVVVTLNVTDRDGDDFTDRTFSITAGNELGNFTFDPEME